MRLRDSRHMNPTGCCLSHKLGMRNSVPIVLQPLERGHLSRITGYNFSEISRRFESCFRVVPELN